MSWERCRFPPLSHGMFDKGDYALVHHAMRRATEAMAAEMEGLPLERMNGDERIVAGVRARLMYLSRFIADGTWPAAMALGALPQHSLDTTAELGIMVDELWYLAGDQSTDASWYSRRGLLLAVHASTELFMLTDKSEGFEETWSFLGRRVSDVSSLGAKAGSVGDVAAAMGTAVTSLAGGAFALVRPFVEAQQGNHSKAVESVFSIIRQFGTTAAEAAAEASCTKATSEPAPATTDATPRV